MERSILLFTCLLALTFGAFAQTPETYDIATFASPAGWQKQTKEGAVIFTISDSKKGSFAMMTLYRSGVSSGSARGDFDADWRQFIAGQLKVENQPKVEPAKSMDGWELVGGGATFESQLGPAVVMLNTFSGHGRSFSFAAIFNNQDILPAIEAFFVSLKLRKPTIATAPIVSSGENSIVGTWGITVVIGSTGSTSYSGTAGSTIKQYTFNKDGSYSFASKTFSFSYDKLLLIKESGSYLISGGNITISPQRSVTQAWSKKDGTDQWGTLLTTQNRTLEKITYSFTKHYSVGLKEWTLVLQSPNVTKRDGPYNGGTAFSNAWMYSPPCSKCLLELP